MSCLFARPLLSLLAPLRVKRLGGYVRNFFSLRIYCSLQRPAGLVLCARATAVLRRGRHLPAGRINTATSQRDLSLTGSTRIAIAILLLI